MILLSDEQIQEAWDNAFDEPVEFDHKPTPEDLLAIGLGAIAKAQLKKVVKMLKSCNGELVCRGNGPFMATFEMTVEDYESMLKEIG